MLSTDWEARLHSLVHSARQRGFYSAALFPFFLGAASSEFKKTLDTWWPVLTEYGAVRSGVFLAFLFLGVLQRACASWRCVGSSGQGDDVVPHPGTKRAVLSKKISAPQRDVVGTPI